MHSLVPVPAMDENPALVRVADGESTGNRGVEIRRSEVRVATLQVELARHIAVRRRPSASVLDNSAMRRGGISGRQMRLALHTKTRTALRSAKSSVRTVRKFHF
jgi:hypothetical protein